MTVLILMPTVVAFSSKKWLASSHPSPPLQNTWGSLLIALSMGSSTMVITPSASTPSLHGWNLMYSRRATKRLLGGAGTDFVERATADAAKQISRVELRRVTHLPTPAI